MRSANRQETVVRTGWAQRDPLLAEYYDTEWGIPVRDEAGVYEQLMLEVFQAGLSWLTVLQRREAIRAAFHGFSPDRVAAYDSGDVQRLLGTDGIIRNRRKIEAVIAGARGTLRLREEGPGLAELVWGHMPERSPVPSIDAEIPRSSAESEALATELKRHGFAFLGPTNVYAAMAAIGMIDTHLVTSHRRGCSGLWNADGTRREVLPLSHSQ